jgi:hypothetical protein
MGKTKKGESFVPRILGYIYSFITSCQGIGGFRFLPTGIKVKAIILTLYCLTEGNALLLNKKDTMTVARQHVSVEASPNFWWLQHSERLPLISLREASIED